jgi:hypothetical protein
VPVGEFPKGKYLVEYQGIPIKLLVVEDYKGLGKRYFFSTNLNDTERILSLVGRIDGISRF